MNNIFVLPLTNSEKLCLIDSENAERVMNYKWLLSQKRILCTSTVDENYNQPLLHNFVLNQRGIDHKNRFAWDNRKCNLREATQAQNTRNVSIRKNTSSNFKGVSWDREREKWYAYINVNKSRTFIGRFNSSVEAAKAYNTKAIELHGEFASLNSL